MGGRPFFVAIVGTRHAVVDVPEVISYLEANDIPADACIVTGDAPGIDTVAKGFAAATGRACFVQVAPWDVLGSPAAAHARNEVIARLADMLLAFPCKHSRGTYDTVRRARAYGRHDLGFTVECRVGEAPTP